MKKESYDEILKRLGTPKYERLKNAGKVVDCLRCGVQCRVAETANRHGRPIQNADGEGYCPSCVTASYLRSPEIDVSYLLPDGVDIREALRAPHIQECFAQLLKVGMSDLKTESIKWDSVIANWDLPFPKVKKKRKPKNDDWAEFIN